MARRSLQAAISLALTLAGLAGVATGAATARVPHHPFWLSKVVVSEYFPVPEEWFVGARVVMPGVAGAHRVDWLYSGSGLSMEGDGIGLDGKRYHVDSTGSGGWVNANGKRTRPSRGGWSNGRPYWRAGGYWRNSASQVTFPLAAGGWSRGVGRSYVQPPAGIAFAAGPSLPLVYWQSVATDPRTIPRGSRVYIAAYKQVNGGWFRADDTGGAIIGRHVDVYRPPPLVRDGAGYLTRQRIYVIPPK